MGSAGGGAMMATSVEHVYRLGEFHSFESAGARFLYLVPAGAIFQVDDAVAKVISCLSASGTPHDALIDALLAHGLNIADAEELVSELFHSNVIVAEDGVAERPQTPP